MKPIVLHVAPVNDWQQPPAEGRFAASGPEQYTGNVYADRGNSCSSPVVFDDAYLQRLRTGDFETTTHFYRYFRRLAGAKIWGRFHRQQEEDLIDEVLATAIQNIIKGQPRDACRLSGYVSGICSNSIKVAMRNQPAAESVDLNGVSDGAKTVEHRIQERQTAQAVRSTLNILSDRDREILLDLFYNELTREEVCLKYGVSGSNLRLILFHARKRFQQKWQSS